MSAHTGNANQGNACCSSAVLRLMRQQENFTGMRNGSVFSARAVFGPFLHVVLARYRAGAGVYPA
jgi:hypothetical protein